MSFIKQSQRQKPISRSDIERLSHFLKLDYRKHFNTLYTGLACFIDGQVSDYGMDSLDYRFRVATEYVRIGHNREFASCTCADWQTDDKRLSQSGCAVESRLTCAHIVACRVWIAHYQQKPKPLKDGRVVNVDGMTCVILTRSIDGIAYIECQQIICDNRTQAEVKLAELGWVISDGMEWVDVAFGMAL